MIRILKINKDVGAHKAGSTFKVQCNNDGIPLDVFWRRRLKDSATDNCVEWKEVETKMNKVVVENKSHSRKPRFKKDKGDKS